MTASEEIKTEVTNRLKDIGRRISGVLNRNNFGFVFTKDGYFDPGVCLVANYTVATVLMIFTNMPTFWVLVVMIVVGILLCFIKWKRLADFFLK